MLELLNGRLN